MSETGSESPRFPKRVYQVGKEPDERFTLANERTFLAWIRTSLALLSAGVGLAALNSALPSPGHHAISVILLIAGILAPVYAWCSWMRNERALRLGVPLPAPTLALPLTILVVAIGAALVFTT